jgi:hypothetical protein
VYKRSIPQYLKRRERNLLAQRERVVEQLAEAREEARKWHQMMS